MYGTDGVGFSIDSDPQLRRCGWDFVEVVNPNFIEHESLSFGACKYGPLLVRQIVFRAELYALVKLCEFESHNMIVVVDNFVLYQG